MVVLLRNPGPELIESPLGCSNIPKVMRSANKEIDRIAQDMVGNTQVHNVHGVGTYIEDAHSKKVEYRV